MYEYLMPIGTVVRLKNAEKLLMISGVMQKSYLSDEDIVYYDYVGVPYPAGYLDSSLLMRFNHDDIEETVFNGYNGTEWQSLKKVFEIADKINKKMR